jgi:hypothetical protein
MGPKPLETLVAAQSLVSPPLTINDLRRAKAQSPASPGFASISFRFASVSSRFALFRQAAARRPARRLSWWPARRFILSKPSALAAP